MSSVYVHTPSAGIAEATAATDQSDAAVSCFHCGLPVPAGIDYALTWEGRERAFCCAGCHAVARTIMERGLGDYYRFRTQVAAAAQEPIPEALRDFGAYDHPAVQASFVRGPGERREAALILEGITCAACVWLNEQQLKRLPGVHDVHVNYATRRAHVAWDERRLRLSDILGAVRDIGYRAQPYDPARSQQLLRDERRDLLRRLGVAGVLGAQIMTLSVALYVGDWSGADAGLARFFVWTSALLALPVLVYSAQPFFRAAWKDLRRRRAGMDVPVVLGMSGAFGASAWNTLTGQGAVYYDSVAMFAFLLLGARYLELGARERASTAAESLVRAVPAVARRLGEDGVAQVAVAELRPGDVVLVPAGEHVPADAVVTEGRSSVDEGLLTGESRPVPKAAGDALIGGSVNVEGPLTARVERVGPDTLLAGVLRLLDRAQSEKPRLAQHADRVASWFVVAVLAIAAATGAYWWAHDPARAAPVVIAVLVVSCPCALGLATPAALTAAVGALTRQGVLTVRAHALEALARATHFVFDKTGTLTLGEPRLARALLLGDAPLARCLALAAALERHSAHPIARGIAAAAPPRPALRAARVEHVPGEGLSGDVEGETYFLGAAEFVRRHTVAALDQARLAELKDAGTVIVLASRRQPLAAFAFEDALRPGAAELVGELARSGKRVLMSSGDAEPAARGVAHALGIGEVHAELKPADKLALVRRLQAQGAVVAMTGDGVNDAPVLAGAQVSIAMGAGAPLAAASADMVLLSPGLGALARAARTARRTTAVIRQNLAWAAGYNVLAIPLAVAGYVPPWLAALGMSASSLLVIGNALRLLKTPKAPRMTTDEHR